MRFKLLLLALLSSFTISAQTVVDIIVNSDDHNTLETAVIEAGLVTTLSGDGPFTVFAPTDAAFDALPDGTLDVLLADPEGALTDVLLYHVVGETILSEDIVLDSLYQTLNRKGIEITIGPLDEVFVNDAQVTVTNLTADNGVVHIIDAVLVPNFSIMDIIEDSDVHTTLEAAIDAVGLTTTLHVPDLEVTIFAPTDAAFDALPDGTLEALLADPDGELTDVLLYHVTGGAVTADMLSDGMLVTTITGKQSTISIDGSGNITIDNAAIVMNDLEAENGVVHVIDAVLIPPTTVYDIVRRSEDHTILELLLDGSGLSSFLNANGSNTLFAPTDAALLALGEENLNFLLSNPGALQSVLLYHLLQDVTVLSEDITNNATPTTAIGLDILLNNLGGVLVNQEAVVTTPDLETSNGVVHVIDAALLPTTTGSIIAASPAFSTLNAALEASGLDAVVGSVDTRLTVFAPTDAAFDALPDGLLEELLADPTNELTTILATHVTQGRAFSSDLSDGQVITTESGKEVTITFDNGNVFVNNAQVIQTDFFTGNGLVHVIDAVIADPSNTVVDIIVNSDVHTTLETAVIEAGLVETLSGDGPFTVFAPTDAAFDALPDGLLDELLADPTGDLTTILTYHVVGAELPSSSLSDGAMAETLQGENVTVSINADGIFVNDAQVVMEDIDADNGIVHVINGILLPDAITSAEVIPADDVNVYPSLIKENVTVEYAKGAIEGKASVYIFDSMGKVVYTNNNVVSGDVLDLNDLDQGIYFLTLTDMKSAATMKITKM